MPDTGEFNPDRTDTPAPADWSQAFAALPQAAPASDGWQRLQARLPETSLRAPRRRRPWLRALAAAASLALAVVIPLKLRDTPAPIANEAAVQAAASAPAPSAASTMAATTPAPDVERRAVITQPAVATDTQSRITHRDANRRAKRIAPAQRPIRTAAPPNHATYVAQGETAETNLEPLYAQSAQLESLLALARDQRVTSGTSAALSDALDNRVAAIDATLIQPGLSDTQRSDLWGQRVDALQQLVGIETTNRLYAARGQHYDAALVSID